MLSTQARIEMLLMPQSAIGHFGTEWQVSSVKAFALHGMGRAYLADEFSIRGQVVATQAAGENPSLHSMSCTGLRCQAMACAERTSQSPLQPRQALRTHVWSGSNGCNSPQTGFTALHGSWACH